MADSPLGMRPIPAQLGSGEGDLRSGPMHAIASLRWLRSELQLLRYNTMNILF
jgi:hypothetical protein